MSYVTNLKCRECGQEYPVSPLHVCETCFGPLEVTYDYARSAPPFRATKLNAARIISGAIANCCRSKASRRSALVPASHRWSGLNASAPRLGVKRLYLQGRYRQPSDALL